MMAAGNPNWWSIQHTTNNPLQPAVAQPAANSPHHHHHPLLHLLQNHQLNLLAGALWYSQFFGLSLGKGFLTESPTLTTFAFCILMALNVTFSNVWGILLKEWKGCSKKTIAVLVVGIVVLIASTFIPELLK